MNADPPRGSPVASPVSFPAGYGDSTDTTDQLLAWTDIERVIAASANYWLATVSATGRPHLRPVDGVFVDATLAIGGSPEARWVRNLLHDPKVSAGLPDDDEAIILEGRAELVADPESPLADAVASANRHKYPQYYADDDAGFRPFWALRPQVVYAWTLTGFPARATRFDFDPERRS